MTYKVTFEGERCATVLIGHTATLTSTGVIDVCGHMKYNATRADSVRIAEAIDFDLGGSNNVMVFCACHTPDVLCPVVDMGEWKGKHNGTGSNSKPLVDHVDGE